MKATFWWCLPLLLLASASGVRADAGWLSIESGSLQSNQEHPTIAMVSEYVDAQLKLDYIAVNAEFTFINNGPATEVTMYFPLMGSSTSLETEDDFDNATDRDEMTLQEPTEIVYPLPDSEFPEGRAGYLRSTIDDYQDFTVEVEGVQVPVELVEKNSLLNGSVMASSIYSRWSVSFGQDEEKHITCKYSAQYEFYTSDFGPPKFAYVLYTGGSWAGPIIEGKVVVRRKLSELDAPWVFFASNGRHLESESLDWGSMIMPSQRPTQISPAKVQLVGNEERIVWEFADYSPGEADNIEVVIDGLVISKENRVYQEARDEFGKQRICALEDSGLAVDGGVAGVTVVEGLNFRIAPSTDAELVEGLAQLGKHVYFAILEASGEWWRIRTADGYEGWIRWRYVDPDNNEEYLYATLVYCAGV